MLHRRPRRAKYQRSTSARAPEPLGLTGDQLPGHAMDCSLWDPLQGFRGFRLTWPNELVPFHRFPLPSLGAGHSGHREALLLFCNFLRVPLDTLFCKRLAHQTCPAPLRLFENSKGLVYSQALPLWKMWETTAEPCIYAVSAHRALRGLISGGQLCPNPSVH